MFVHVGVHLVDTGPGKLVEHFEQGQFHFDIRFELLAGGAERTADHLRAERVVAIAEFRLAEQIPHAAVEVKQLLLALRAHAFDKIRQGQGFFNFIGFDESEFQLRSERGRTAQGFFEVDTVFEFFVEARNEARFE